jgi:chromosome segregation ATPase
VQVTANAAELDDANFAKREEAALSDVEASKAALAEATGAVEAASSELDGVRAGDGRDSSNRSLEERLADAVNAQTMAESELREAELRAKHTTKELAAARKTLAAKQKEGSHLDKKLEVRGERGVIPTRDQQLPSLVSRSSFNCLTHVLGGWMGHRRRRRPWLTARPSWKHWAMTPRAHRGLR